MRVRVLINDNPARMIPIGCAVMGACRTGHSAWCGSAHAGDTFTAFDLDVADAPDAIPSGRFDNDAPELHVLEEAFAIGNGDEDRGVRWPADARSMSIGDVVLLGESAFACAASPGWILLDADTVRSFEISERTR